MVHVRNLALVFLILGFTEALKEKMYQKAIVHKDSFNGISREPIEFWEQMACSISCTKVGPCDAFFLSAKGKCKISSLNKKALVETSSKSLEALEIFYESPTAIERTTHFLVIHDTGYIEDFSENPEKSPPIKSYPSSHSMLGAYSSYLLENDLTLTVVEARGGSGMYQWNFDSQQFKKLHITMPIHGSNAQFTSQNGALFVSGGNSYVSENRVTFYKNGTFRVIAKPPEPIFKGCATFIPDDNYHIYIIAGIQTLTNSITQKCWVYNIQLDTYAPIAPTPNPVATFSCTGARTKEHKAAIVTVGGYKSLTGIVDLTVYKYMVDDNEWSLLPNYPVAIRVPGVVFWKGYIYVFSGLLNQGNDKQVRRMELSSGTSGTWESVGQLKYGSTSPVVIPYNA